MLNMMDTGTTPQLKRLGAWLVARPEPLWFIGGAVRDRLAGRMPHDIDLVVQGEARRLAADLARAIGGSLAMLDGTAGVYRVALPGTPLTIDIAELRGPTIVADLERRDFTINAIAIAFTLEAWNAFTQGAGNPAIDVIDPLDGLRDLSARHLRLAAPSAFVDDPLRILRAARFATVLELTPTPELIAAAREAAPALRSVAPERIAAEMLALVAGPRGTAAMYALDDLGALTICVPPLAACRGVTQGRMHHWDVFDHTLHVVDAIEETIALLRIGLTEPPGPAIIDPLTQRVAHPTSLDFGGQNQEILAHMAEPLTAGRTRSALLKLAALFHDVGKPATRIADASGTIRFPGHAEAGLPLTEAVVAAWRLGRRTRRYITAIVHHHMRPGQFVRPLERQPSPSTPALGAIPYPALRHYFRDTGMVGLDVAVFSIADHFAVYGPDPLNEFWIGHYAIVAEMIRRYYREPEEVIPPRLIDGHDLMVYFNLSPGPQVRAIREAVHTARLDGTINTRAEALSLAEELIGATEQSAQP